METLESWEALVDALRSTTWQPAHQTNEGTIFYANDPFYFDYGEAEWYFDTASDPIEQEALITFLWDSSGAPISWSGSVDLLSVGQDAYVSYWLEPVEEMVHIYFAKVTPGNSPALLRQVLWDLMHDDAGDGFQDVAGRLPDTLTNVRPDLIDEATLRAGCWDMMQARSEREGSAWYTLRESNELNRRPPALSRSGGASVEPETTDADIDETERRRILDEYFAVSYSEHQD